MRALIFFLVAKLLVLALAASCSAQVKSSKGLFLQEGTAVALANAARSKVLLNQEDDYTKNLSQFDLMAKLQKLDTTLKSSDYLNFAASQALDWTPQEEKRMIKTIGVVSQRIAKLGLKLNLPQTIEFVKSTGAEEGNAAYTRANYVVFSKEMLKTEHLDDLVAHELFHILTRHDPAAKEKIYMAHGFLKCNEVPYPAEMAHLKISNPDAPYNDYYIKLKHADHNIEAAIIIHSESVYQGGIFFSYLKKSLLVLTGKDEKKPKYVNGKPLLLNFAEVERLYEQIGKNTEYNIHIEEVAADHFSMLLNETSNLPNSNLLEAMKVVLKGGQ